MYLCHDHLDVDADVAHLALLGVVYGVYEGEIDGPQLLKLWIGTPRESLAIRNTSPSPTITLLIVSNVYVHQGQMFNDFWGFQ